MTRDALLQATLLLPIAAAVLAVALAGTRSERAVPPLLLLLAAVAAAVVAGFEAEGRHLSWQGFEGSAWGGVIAAAAILPAAAAAASARNAAARTATGIAAAAVAASAFAPDLLWLGLPIPLATAACVLAFRADGGSPRALIWLLGSDVLACAGLAVAASGSLQPAPPRSAIAAGLLIAGGLLRMAVSAFASRPESGQTESAVGITTQTASESGTGRLLLAGPIRAQGALLCAIAVAGGPGRGWWLAGAAAAVGVLAWLSSAAGRSSGAAHLLPVVVAAAGFGVGGSVAVAGAVIAITASAAAQVIGSRGGFGMTALALSPLAGLLTGVVLVAGAAMQRAVVDTEMIPVVFGVILCALAAIPDAYRTATDGAGDAPVIARPVVFLLSAPALVVLGAVAFAPGFTLEQAVAPAASLGAAAAAAVASPPFVFPTDLALAAAVLGLLGWVIGAVARPALTPTPAEPGPVSGDVPPTDDESFFSDDARPATSVSPWPQQKILVGLGVGSIAAAAWLFVQAGARGWL